MNIVISGLTAAGKTTHARLLAKHLGFDYVSASQLLAKAAGVKVHSGEHWWLASGATVAAAREEGGLDEDLDRKMVSLARGVDCTVFDAWALPWTSNAPLMRIWLQSDFPSRFRKCFVSHMNERVSYSDCVEIVEGKDDESQAMFKRLYGFDLFSDHEVFDVIIDLSELIPQPTLECSRESISRADSYLKAAVAVFSGQSSDGLAAAVARLPTNAIVRGPGSALP
jgi:cytidylate kinase